LDLTRGAVRGAGPQQGHLSGVGGCRRRDEEHSLGSGHETTEATKSKSMSMDDLKAHGVEDILIPVVEG
jgi:hypothetical protein